MKKILCFCIVGIVSPCLSILANQPDKNSLKFITESYPPYNYIENGEFKGIAIEILKNITKDLNIPLTKDNLFIMPWARSYKMTLKNPNYCLFTMTKTKEREKLFQLVGPMPKFDSASIFVRREKASMAVTFEHMKTLLVGVLRNDIAYTALIEKGFPKEMLIENDSVDSLSSMLAKGYVDGFAIGEESFSIVMKKNGHDVGLYKKIYDLDTGDSFFAFSPLTSKSIVREFQHSFDKFVKNGVIEKIILKYRKS